MQLQERMRICVEFLVSVVGATVVEGQKEHTLRLVRHVRRFFAKEAPAEIWALFRPKMDNLHSSQAMEVCATLIASVKA